jgi:MFS family permease
VLPVLAANVLNVGANGYGLLFAAMGAGALTSALFVATLPRPHIRVLIGGGMILGAAELLLASTTLFPLALVAVFFCGVGAVSTAASANSLVQVAVPGQLRGRVMSVYTTVFVGSSPIGNGFTGGVGGLWGTPAALVANGAVTLGAEVIAAIAVLRIGASRFRQELPGGRPRVPAAAPTDPGAVATVE